MTDSILADKYQQKTDKQHILDNPDTYIGSVENVESSLWIMNDTGDKIIEKGCKNGSISRSWYSNENWSFS